MADSRRQPTEDETLQMLDVLKRDQEQNPEPSLIDRLSSLLGKKKEDPMVLENRALQQHVDWLKRGTNAEDMRKLMDEDARKVPILKNQQERDRGITPPPAPPVTKPPQRERLLPTPDEDTGPALSISDRIHAAMQADRAATDRAGQYLRDPSQMGQDILSAGKGALATAGDIGYDIVRGVPGAQSAIAGARSLINQTPYSDEARRLENYNEQHPTTYEIGHRQSVVAGAGPAFGERASREALAQEALDQAMQFSGGIKTPGPKALTEAQRLAARKALQEAYSGFGRDLPQEIAASKASVEAQKIAEAIAAKPEQQLAEEFARKQFGERAYEQVPQFKSEAERMKQREDIASSASPQEAEDFLKSVASPEDISAAGQVQQARLGPSRDYGMTDEDIDRLVRQVQQQGLAPVKRAEPQAIGPQQPLPPPKSGREALLRATAEAPPPAAPIVPPYSGPTYGQGARWFDPFENLYTPGTIGGVPFERSVAQMGQPGAKPLSAADFGPGPGEAINPPGSAQRLAQGERAFQQDLEASRAMGQPREIAVEGRVPVQARPGAIVPEDPGTELARLSDQIAQKQAEIERTAKNSADWTRAHAELAKSPQFQRMKELQDQLTGGPQAGKIVVKPDESESRVRGPKRPSLDELRAEEQRIQLERYRAARQEAGYPPLSPEEEASWVKNIGLGSQGVPAQTRPTLEQKQAEAKSITQAQRFLKKMGAKKTPGEK